MRAFALALLLVVGPTLGGVSAISPPPPSLLDADGDGLPQAWEATYGLDDADVTDEMGADGDPDGDGATNLEEWEAGTHPRGMHTQYFAEGAVGPVFDTRLAVANPDPVHPAVVLVRFLSAGGAAASTTVVLPPRSRRTVDAREVPDIGTEFSMEISSSRPVVAERTMEWHGGGSDAHAETATARPGRSWYFAEGATHSGFRLFYLVYNPGDAPAAVTVDYLFADGPPLRRTHLVAPHTRFTIWVNQEHPRLAAAEVSTHITADVPVVVERAMYTNAPDGQLLAGHAASGTAAPGPTWYFAEGATGSFFSTFLLLMNPSIRASDVEVTYLRAEGAPIRRTYRVPGLQRFTVWVNQAAPELASTSTGMTVRSLDGTGIVAERAMWWPADGRGFRASHVTAGMPGLSPTWAFAGGESLGRGTDSTYLLLANPGAVDTAVRVTLLPETGVASARDLWLPIGARTTVDVATMFPDMAGRRFGALVEALAPAAGIVAERSWYSNAGGELRAGTCTRGQDPRRLLEVDGTWRLPRGGAPLLLSDLVVPGRTATLTADSSAPGVATVAVLPDGSLRVTPVGTASGWVTITVSAVSDDGSRDTRRLRIKVGDPVAMTHVVTASAPGTYLLPAQGDAATTYEATVIENTGTTTVTGIELFEDGQDWSSVDAILASATRGLTTPDERARALWQFARTHHVLWWSATIDTDLHDPVVALNGFGYMFCDDIAAILGLLFERAGMPARMWNLGVDRHTVVEAFYDGDWHMFDASLGGLFLERDNRTVAGVADIVADPDLVARGGWREAFALSLWMLPGHLSYPASVLAREGHRMGLTLHPGERVSLRPASTGRRYMDRSLQPPAGLEPPILGSGRLESRLDGRVQPAPGRLRSQRDVVSTSRGLVRTAPDATAVLEVGSPWPVVGGRLRAVVAPGSAGETIAIDVSASGTGFDFDWSELVSGRFRVPGAYVAEGNLRTFRPEQYGPAVHNGPGGTPGYIEYLVRPSRQSGVRTRLTGLFYRGTADDIVAVQVSGDGVHWPTAWEMETVGGGRQVVDLTAAMAGCDPCGLRLLVQGSHAAAAGLDALALEGLEPFGWQTVWTGASEAMAGPVDVDVPLDALVHDYDGAMVFAYHVRVRWTGTGPQPAALESIALETDLQVSPFAIVQPAAAPVRVAFRTQTQGQGAIRIEHRWWLDAARHRPAAPRPTQLAAGEPVDASMPFHLGWATSADPDGDTLITYHVQVCDEPDCRYPLSAVFDEQGTFSDPGADRLFGTADDGPPVPIISTHWMYLHTWLRAGATYSWRVRVQDSSGLWSEWSPLGRFTAVAHAP